MTTEPYPGIIAMENQTTYFYFSYGSNMLKERIHINDPNAKPYAAAKLDVIHVHQHHTINLGYYKIFFIRITA